MSPIRALLVSLTFAASLLTGSGCARSQPRANDAQGTPPARTSAIEGRILHPAHVLPALRICAIGSGTPAEAKRICIDTRRGQYTYRIENLPPDDYVVIAAADAGPGRIGGHMQQVQCIRAPCPEMPASVTVAAGATVAGIDINGFYEKRDDFPAISAGAEPPAASAARRDQRSSKRRQRDGFRGAYIYAEIPIIAGPDSDPPRRSSSVWPASSIRLTVSITALRLAIRSACCLRSEWIASEATAKAKAMIGSESNSSSAHRPLAVVALNVLGSFTSEMCATITSATTSGIQSIKRRAVIASATIERTSDSISSIDLSSRPSKSKTA